jgi:quercetin dioxygenase-like cupin family protein
MKIVRASEQAVDRSDPGVDALRLVHRANGAKTMTAGVATFEPGASILLHTHPTEETVIIVEGSATAHVQGKKYSLEKYDTTIMPPNVPHYFENNSDRPMTIAYFYPTADVQRDPYTGPMPDTSGE